MTPERPPHQIKAWEAHNARVEPSRLAFIAGKIDKDQYHAARMDSWNTFIKACEGAGA